MSVKWFVQRTCAVRQCGIFTLHCLYMHDPLALQDLRTFLGNECEKLPEAFVVLSKRPFGPNFDRSTLSHSSPSYENAPSLI